MTYLRSMLFVLLLGGCASPGVDRQQVATAILEKSTRALAGEAQYRLDYLVSGKRYAYLTYSLAETGRYLQLLVENERIIAASAIDKVRYYWPALRRCTLFPHHDELDVNRCLDAFNREVLQQNDPAVLTTLWVNDAMALEADKLGAFGVATEAAMLAPLLLPVAVIASPVLVFEHAKTKGQRQNFTLALGQNKGLDDYVAAIDHRFVSERSGAGTAYLEAGILDQPAVAFGFDHSQVVWIQQRPYWVCGGGFMFWGVRCTVGEHDDKHW